MAVRGSAGPCAGRNRPRVGRELLRKGAGLVVLLVAGCGGAGGTPIACDPGRLFCIGQDVHLCGADGRSGTFVARCLDGHACFRGACIEPNIGTDDGLAVADVRDVPPETVADAVPDAGKAEDVAVASDVAIPQDEGWDARDPGGAADAEDPGPAEVADSAEAVEVTIAPDVADIPDVPDPADLGNADTPSVCGNGVREPDEACDADDLGGKDCTGLGYPGGGPLRCLDSCRLDTLLCGADSHRFVYANVVNGLVKDAFNDVAWHPSGDYALLAGQAGAVARYDPSKEGMQALSLVGTSTGVYLTRIAFAPSGDAWITGWDSDGGHVFRVPDGATGIDEVPDGAQAAFWETIKFAPDGSFALLAGRSKTGGPNYILKLDPASGALSGYKGSGLIGAGATDLMFIPEGILPLGLAALVTAGQNGTGSFLWYAYSGEFLTSGQPGSFGNIGRVAWRPGGSYGLAAGWTSSVLYLYDGKWQDTVYLPNADIGSGVQEVAFRPDGRRALVIGTTWNGTVRILDHRPKGEAFSDDDFVSQALTGFDQKPYFADSDTRMDAAAFRPGTTCDEGLIVGDDPGDSWSPSFGMVVRFRDSDFLDCP